MVSVIFQKYGNGRVVTTDLIKLNVMVQTILGVKGLFVFTYPTDPTFLPSKILDKK